MSIIAGIIEGATNSAANLAKTGFDIYSQIKNQNYQRKLQQKIFDREDNAVQRRAEDLEKAGLSKTLAAGSPAGAGNVVTSSAPEMHIGKFDAVARINDLKIQNKQLAQQDAEIQKLQQDTKNAELDATMKQQMIDNNEVMNPLKAEELRLNNEASGAKIDQLKHDLQVYQETGIPTNAPESLKFIAGTYGLTKKMWKTPEGIEIRKRISKALTGTKFLGFDMTGIANFFWDAKDAQAEKDYEELKKKDAEFQKMNNIKSIKKDHKNPMDEWLENQNQERFKDKFWLPEEYRW